MRNNGPSLRRSSRVPVTLPILVTSMEPGSKFSEVCETTVVNAHGCAMRSPMQLEAGAPVHFHTQDGRETTAKVVSCQPIGANRQSWVVAASFDQPENFWGLKAVPKDWMLLHAAPEGGDTQTPATEQATAVSVKLVLERIRKQLSDEHLKVVLGELLHPFEAEVTELRNKLTQGARRNRFEVSLSQIPPEVEQQLELRLKNDLGPQMLKQAHEQSEQVLQAAKKTIAETTKAAHEHFLQRMTRDLEGVEQRTQRISENGAQSLREHLNRGLGELHQEVTDAGGHLKLISEDLLKVMRQNLAQEHEARTNYLERVQAAVAAESLRLQQQISDLDQRVTRLGESAQALESGLDQRLSKMASDTVRTARGQMEGVLEQAVSDLNARGAQECGRQLEEAGANLATMRDGIERSVAESLKAQAGEILQSFEREMRELAQLSVERWRTAFTGGLNSLVRILGEQFVLQAESSDAARFAPNDKVRAPRK